jgi:autotransporter-associated beta strand protein
MTLGSGGGGATFDTAGYAVTLSGSLSGPGSLTKVDSGTLTLTANNSYAGKTTVNAGILSLTGSLSSSSALVVGGGTFSYAPAGNGGAGNRQTVAGLTVNSGASTVNASTGNTLALGPMTRNMGGAVNFNNNASGTITTTRTNTYGILGPWATYGSGTSMNYAAAGGSSAPYTIVPYTAATAVTSGVSGLTNLLGTVNYALSGGGGTLTAAVRANTLQFTGAANTITASTADSLSLNGIMSVGSGMATIAGGNLIAGNTRELVITGPGDVTVAAAIQDNGNGASALTMAGGGTLLLAGADSFSGNTLIDSGTIALANSGALQRSTLDTSGAGTLSFGSLTCATLGGLSGPGTLPLANASSGAVALSAGNNNASTTYSGMLQGAGSLNKVGSGTLVLSGANSYIGGTTVSDGRLLVTASAALPDGTSLTVGGAAAFTAAVVPAAASATSAATVPEPGTLVLLSVAGLVAVAVAWRRRRN